MKKLLGLAVLILSFSASHLTYAQVDCTSTCRCSIGWTVLDSGCEYTYDCYDIGHQSCQPGYNHCCYYELGYCNNGTSCQPTFEFRSCYRDTCNY